MLHISSASSQGSVQGESEGSFRKPGVCVFAVLPGSLFLGAVIVPLASALLAGFQEFYLPLPESQTQDAFVSIRTGPTESMPNIAGGTASADNTVIYYDHRENGLGGLERRHGHGRYVRLRSPTSRTGSGVSTSARARTANRSGLATRTHRTSGIKLSLAETVRMIKSLSCRFRRFGHMGTDQLRDLHLDRNRYCSRDPSRSSRVTIKFDDAETNNHVKNSLHCRTISRNRTRNLELLS